MNLALVTISELVNYKSALIFIYYYSLLHD